MIYMEYCLHKKFRQIFKIEKNPKISLSPHTKKSELPKKAILKASDDSKIMRTLCCFK